MSSTATGDTWTHHRPKLQRSLPSEGHFCVSLACMTFSSWYSIFWVPHYCKTWPFNLIQKAEAWHFICPESLYHLAFSSFEYMKSSSLNARCPMSKQEAAAADLFSISKPKLLILRPDVKRKNFFHMLFSFLTQRALIIMIGYLQSIL